MFSVQLRNGLEGAKRFESHFRVFNDLEDAIHFAINHRDYFMRLMYHNGEMYRDIYDTIRRVDYGFELYLYREYIG